MVDGNLALEPLKISYLYTAVAMATKLGRMVTYYEELPPI